MTAEQYDKLPHFIEVREVRYKVDTPGFRSEEITLVTTLTDAQRYPLKALAELYLKRWLVETNFSHLKTTMGMDILRCKTVDGVLKELYSFCVVYNLVRLVMLEAGIRQQVETERISFVDALRWLATAQPGELLPTLVINPSRPNRVEPRVKKRRPKEYPLMRMPRSVLQNKLLNQKLAA